MALPIPIGHKSSNSHNSHLLLKILHFFLYYFYTRKEKKFNRGWLQWCVFSFVVNKKESTTPLRSPLTWQKCRGEFQIKNLIDMAIHVLLVSIQKWEEILAKFPKSEKGWIFNENLTILQQNIAQPIIWKAPLHTMCKRSVCMYYFCNRWIHSE